jgi:hypothetical protein
MSSLKLERCEHTQRRVTPLAIVEDLEVFEDCTGQFDACAPAFPIEQFDLHATPEGFHHRVVVAVADRTHRREQPGVDGATSERPRRELEQYLAIRYTERLAEAGAVTSVGSRGDSYDNALAESFNGLYKAELIRRRAWRGLDDVEFETLEYIDWFNHRRLHGEIGMVPPAELEATHYHQSSPVAVAGTQ